MRLYLQLGDAGELLREGASGDMVRQLQQLLTQRGFNTGGIDGIFGAKTKQAVISFQANEGITIDGIVGPQTWAALQSIGPASRPVAVATPPVTKALAIAPPPVVRAAGNWTSGLVQIVLGGLAVNMLFFRKKKRSRK